jgi:glycosyltransferase involved in cell wall biosynthesis
MTSKPIISVIIPSYNEEKLLPYCLKSVLNQDFPRNKYEIIVVNNASTDKTPQIAKKFKVKLINEPKKGLVRARNAGFKAAKGKYLVNLDADCLVPRNWLKRIEQNFRSNKNLVFLTGPTVPKKGEKNPLDFLNIKIVSFFYQNFHQLIAYWGGNAAMRKKALIKVGGYNLHNPYNDELALLHKFKKVGQVDFDSNLKVISSNRRVKGRFLKFLFWEVLILYLLNNLYHRFTRKHWRQWETIR